MVMAEPSDPVDFLAKWLLKYVDNVRSAEIVSCHLVHWIMLTYKFLHQEKEIDTAQKLKDQADEAAALKREEKELLKVLYRYLAWL